MAHGDRIDLARTVGHRFGCYGDVNVLICNGMGNDGVNCWDLVACSQHLYGSRRLRCSRWLEPCSYLILCKSLRHDDAPFGCGPSARRHADEMWAWLQLRTFNLVRAASRRAHRPRCSQSLERCSCLTCATLCDLATRQCRRGPTATRRANAI